MFSCSACPGSGNSVQKHILGWFSGDQESQADLTSLIQVFPEGRRSQLVRLAATFLTKVRGTAGGPPRPLRAAKQLTAMVQKNGAGNRSIRN
ncbi:hypothetical protein B0G80_5006 [Paraburkholderia sp. BL6669N2]|nr:hypothetical protein B0G80_5006 [Paraburkholderia sp. BL6669N2]